MKYIILATEVRKLKLKEFLEENSRRRNSFPVISAIHVEQHSGVMFATLLVGKIAGGQEQR